MASRRDRDARATPAAVGPRWRMCRSPRRLKASGRTPSTGTAHQIPAVVVHRARRHPRPSPSAPPARTPRSWPSASVTVAPSIGTLSGLTQPRSSIPPRADAETRGPISTPPARRRRRASGSSRRIAALRSAGPAEGVPFATASPEKFAISSPSESHSARRRRPRAVHRHVHARGERPV